MVYLALYKGKGPIGNTVIRYWTKSIYSHCEIVVDGVCYSSSLMDKGVRSKEIDLEDGKWDLIPLPWVNPQDVINYFRTTDHYKYGYWGIITSQFLNRNGGEKEAPFCSEWCAAIIGYPTPSILSPHTLGELCLWLNEKWEYKDD